MSSNLLGLVWKTLEDYYNNDNNNIKKETKAQGQSQLKIPENKKPYMDDMHKELEMLISI